MSCVVDFRGFDSCLSDADESCFGNVPGRAESSEARRSTFSETRVYVNDFISLEVSKWSCWLVSMCCAMCGRRWQIVLKMHICDDAYAIGFAVCS